MSRRPAKNDALLASLTSVKPRSWLNDLAEEDRQTIEEIRRKYHNGEIIAGPLHIFNAVRGCIKINAALTTFRTWLTGPLDSTEVVDHAATHKPSAKARKQRQGASHRPGNRAARRA